MSSSSSSVGRNSVIMGVGTAASRITGQARTILLAGAIGTTGLAANAYQAGTMIPQAIFTVVSGGIFNAILVPQIVRILQHHDAPERLNKLVTFAMVFLFGVTLITTLATPLLTRLYTDGGDDMLALSTSFTLWCMPQVFFYGLYTVLGQILAAKNRFGAYAWSSVGANLISCCGLTAFILLFGRANNEHLTFWTQDKMILTAGAWTLGVAFQALILLAPLRRLGLGFRPSWGYHGIGLRSIGPVAAWSLGIVVVGQITSLFMTRVANGAPAAAHRLYGISQLSVAGNATYQNAFAIYILPYALIAVSVATALFPKISQALVDHRIDEVRSDLSASLRQIGLIMFFFTAVFIAVPTPIALTLLPSISVEEAQLMAPPFIALALALPLASAYLLIQRTFYAFEDSFHPFLFIVVQNAIQLTTLLVGVLVTSPLHWATVLGASCTIGYALAFPVLVWMMRKHFAGHMDGRRILFTHVKAIFAALVALITGVLLRTPVYTFLGVTLVGIDMHMTWLQALGSCAILGPVVLVAYLLVLWLLRTEELNSAISSLRERVIRRHHREI